MSCICEYLYCGVGEVHFGELRSEAGKYFRSVSAERSPRKDNPVPLERATRPALFLSKALQAFGKNSMRNHPIQEVNYVVKIG